MAEAGLTLNGPGMFAGVDTGGTFTDLVLNHHGRLVIHKLLSTPHDPSLAMLAGLEALTADEGGLAALAAVAHGSTVATNAILERRGAKIAFITTRGFRDLLFIGRQNRPPDQLYALHPTLPSPLVPRERCHEVPERLDHTGAVLLPLAAAALDAVLTAVLAQQVEAVAICLLYSFINPTHEHAIRDRLREHGFTGEIALSSDVLPEFREYERASATVLEAYVRPVMARYITRVQTQLQRPIPFPDPIPLRIMKSDGGVMPAARVTAQAIQTALSGPAAGVIGAFHLAKLAGYDRIITLDMGGTSTDVALCPGALVRRPESQIDQLPLRIRLLDIETVGAGGGSIARVDAGGALRVGPASAGADPGPISYGRGGTQVTVSDANAVLGRLNADRFLGGRMRLEVAAAREAMVELSTRIGLDVDATAAGVLAIASANIERAVRRVSVERGYDPREFTLVAFGGAGGLHACDVADRLGMRRILIPRYPGVLCAFGLLVADVTAEYSRSVLRLLDETAGSGLLRVASELLQQGQAEYPGGESGESTGGMTPTFTVLLDLRYQGQAYELTLPLIDPHAPDAAHTTLRIDDLLTRFHTLHEQTYGFALRDRPVEVVNVRVQMIGVVNKPVLEAESLTGSALTGREFERDDLLPGATFAGEALIYQLDSTTYIAPGWSVRVDAWRNLIVERDQNEPSDSGSRGISRAAQRADDPGSRIDQQVVD